MNSKAIHVMAMALTGALFLSGCAVGPDYRAPEPDVALSYGDELSPTTLPSNLTTRPVRITQWWATLDDPVLDSLIQRAVGNNLDLRQAQAHVLEARSRMIVANAGQLPGVDVGGTYQHQRYSKEAAPFNAFDIPGFPWEFDLFQAGFDASWEIDFFGSVRRGNEAAAADVGASVEDRRSALLSVMAEVARNYVELRGAQKRLKIAEENLRVQKTTLSLTEDRRRNGIATDLDVARAQAEVAKTSAEAPSLESRQWQAIHRLSVLVGRRPTELAALLAPAKAIPLPPSNVPIGVPADLLRRRPDIRGAERRLAAATARIGVAVADLYPRLTINGTLSLQSSDAANFLTANSRSLAIGPSLSWPLFDAGKFRAVVDERSAEQVAALAYYQQTVLRALEETHNAIVSFETEQERQKALTDEVAADQRAADLAQQSYSKGFTDFLTVLDAERSLYESQDALAQSDQAVTTDLIALYKALGGGWEIELLNHPAAPGANQEAAR